MAVEFVVGINLSCYMCYRLQTLQALVIMCTTYFKMQSFFRSQHIKIIFIHINGHWLASFSHRNQICRIKYYLIELNTSKLNAFFCIFPSYISSFTFQHICALLFSRAKILKRKIIFVPTGNTHVPEQ
jgi:hypothetical protein